MAKLDRKKKNLLEKSDYYKKLLDHHTSQAQAAKIGTIIGGATTGVATIATIANFLEGNQRDGYTLLMFATLLLWVCYGAHSTYKDNTTQAKKAYTKLRNTQHALCKTLKKQKQK